MRLVFDAGRGCALRLGQLGIRLGSIDRVFLTHFHSDHLNGLQDLWATSYIGAPYAGRIKPLALQGPVGTVALGRAMAEAMRADVAIREADEKVDPAATSLESSEFDADGVVFERDGLRVTAFRVDHGEQVTPAYGYRIDYAGHAVLLSGDTKPCQNLLNHGDGLDLLVHEVCALSPGMEADPRAARIMAHHTSPEDAGRIFARLRPKRAVFSHVGELAWPGYARVTDADVLARTRATYDGPLTMGLDLMQWHIASAVTQLPFRANV